MREWNCLPFKKSPSKVYYTSELDSWASSTSRDILTKKDHGFSLRDTSGIPNSAYSSSEPCQRPIKVEEKSIILEESSILVENTRNTSPTGSFNGSIRGSPLYQSNDSGYSDSGESTTGTHNDSYTPSSSVPSSPPHVKHITRIYFGDGPEQDARLYNDKIICSSEFKNNSSYVSPYNTMASTITRTSSPINSTDKSPNSYESNSNSSRPRYEDSKIRLTDLDELSEQLENKSILDTTRNTSDIWKRITPIEISLRGLSRINKFQINPQIGSKRQTQLQNQRQCTAADVQTLTEENQVTFKSPFFIPATSSKSTSTHDLASNANRSYNKSNFKMQLEQGTLIHSDNSFTCKSLSSIPTNVNAIHKDAPKTNDESAVEIQLSLPYTLKTSYKPNAWWSKLHSSGIARDSGNGPVQQWLTELCNVHDSECMNTLQSKSLPCDPGKPISTTNIKDAICAIQHRAHQVSTEFAKLCQRLEWLQLEELPKLAHSVVDHISNYLGEYENYVKLQPRSSIGCQSRVIQQLCSNLTEVCRKDSSNSRVSEKEISSVIPNSTRQMVQIVTSLGHAFTKLVDLMLSREIQVLVRVIQDPPGGSDASLIWTTVSHITTLGLNGGHICRLVARLGGIRALLGHCLVAENPQLQVAVLRAITTVCCVIEGIQELEKAGGVEVVSEILCNEKCSEAERSEAAGVLAQITSPWVENNHCLPALYKQMNSNVKALTGLCSSTKSVEIFSLGSAALANLTFLDGGCVSAMRAAGTHKVLIQAQSDNSDLSIFTKDHIATVLANLVGSGESAREVVEAGGVNCLLELLQTKPGSNKCPQEVATLERVQQKSAIALSRLCGEEKVARMLVTLGCAHRLVKLCKDDAERNHSDAVLVACLAALRKMSSALGAEELRGIGAAELVEPKLLDSFHIYSSKQESYI